MTVKPNKGQPDQPAGTWQVHMLEALRRLIQEAEPAITEERKWMKPTKPEGVPVWSRAGMVCTGETYQKVVKLTFMHGASLPDPKHLFNASLEGNARRAIDIREDEVLDAQAVKALVQAAVAHNMQSAAKKPRKKTQP